MSLPLCRILLLGCSEYIQKVQTAILALSIYPPFARSLQRRSIVPSFAHSGFEGRRPLEYWLQFTRYDRSCSALAVSPFSGCREDVRVFRRFVGPGEGRRSGWLHGAMQSARAVSGRCSNWRSENENIRPVRKSSSP
jgi:hypothetical protein